jgi:hypothetical protein
LGVTEGDGEFSRSSPQSLQAEIYPSRVKRRNKVERDASSINAEIGKIWKALSNLDKADIQTTALCHAIVTLMIDKGIVTQEQAAEELGKSIPKVMALRKGIADAAFDQDAYLNPWMENQTVQ